MHIGQRYTFAEFMRWTRRDNLWLVAVATIPTIAYVWLGATWLAVPWVPIALVGTASAFIVGFRNNATYARAWEARQIWGAIVNASRSWGMAARDFVQPTDALSADDAATVRTRLVHRHIGWLTALRYQLRQPRPWESTQLPHTREYRDRYFSVPELVGSLDHELRLILSDDDANAVLSASNRATALLALQSRDLADLHAHGVLDSFHRVALHDLLTDLTTQQGKCERIKNFPYPRQFATINLFFVRLFVWLTPLGLLGEFGKLEGWRVWLTIPFAYFIGWVFNAMERIGEATENPFEGNANDTPITALSRTIEIDLREMLGEATIPKPLEAQHNIQL